MKFPKEEVFYLCDLFLFVYQNVYVIIFSNILAIPFSDHIYMDKTHLILFIYVEKINRIFGNHIFICIV
jgi:hypothetical protein